MLGASTRGPVRSHPAFPGLGNPVFRTIPAGRTEEVMATRDHWKAWGHQRAFETALAYGASQNKSCSVSSLGGTRDHEFLYARRNFGAPHFERMNVGSDPEPHLSATILSKKAAGTPSPYPFT